MFKDLKEGLWGFIAKQLARPAVSAWIIQRAMKTPWFPIPGIMDRYWLFNPYFEVGGNGGEEKKRSAFWNLLPTIRVHHIISRDQDPHLHDHPWDCRTIILRGRYIEVVYRDEFEPMIPQTRSNREFKENMLVAGHTATLGPNKYHKIHDVNQADAHDGYGIGAWTLFFTWKYKEPWGFMVKGKKMLSREYFEYRKQWRQDE